MKNLKNYFSIAMIAILGLFVTSCSTTINVAKKKHGNGYYVNISKSSEVVNAKQSTKKTPVKTTKTEIAAISQVSANPEVVVEITKIEKEEKLVISETSSNIVTNSISKKNSSKKQLKKSKRLAKKIAKAKNTSNNSGDEKTLLLLILAILLPPLAVFLVKGLNIQFWISLLLTFLFWLPGVIYALLIVMGVI